jgi:hypothetical protein
MENNFVTITTSNKLTSKPIFKWNNNYSWTYNGNLAGKSQIKEAVKTAGGRVDGVLRFSIIWNDEGQNDHSDLDAWCKQPDGMTIGYSSGYRKDSGDIFSSCGGQLDLDDRGSVNKIHVENIYFKQVNEMKDGVYTFWINQYSARASAGFKAEIEFDGELYSYEHRGALRTDDKKLIARVTLTNGVFSIVHVMPSNNSSKDIWGLETNNFHKVNLICLSPNHWSDNNVGNKYYFFMLENATPTTSMRSFHNENLINELLTHRKVLDVLGARTMIEPKGKVLSGLGFNATVKDELIVKVQGSFKRMLKIKF